MSQTTSRHRLNLSINISDTGIGIAEDQIEEIFSSFTQQKHQSQRYGGTGLGLTISKRLVEMMGGNISVSSTLGQGSCFKIELPDIEICRQTQNALVKEPPLSGKLLHFQPATLLVVDDVNFNRQLLKSYLRDYPELTLVEAESGEQALTLIGEQNFDLIFMDRRLPGEDGDTTCAKIRKIPGYADIPIIMISASALLLPIEQHTTFYNVQLNKPVNKTELLSAMQSFLATDENSEIASESLTTKAAEGRIQEVMDPEKLPELIDLLSSSYQTTITRLNNSNALHINAIANIAEELMQIAQTYCCIALYDWASTLKKQADLFDLNNLPKTLGSFQALLTQLQNNSESRPT